MRGTRGSTRSRLRTAPWDRNELWRRAQAVPSLDQRFAEDKSLVDAISGQNLITFTRASSAMFVGSDGVWQTAPSNAPRFDHNPLTGESLGLLVEEQRTNLCLYSEEFDIWNINSGTTVATNATASPRGTTTASKIVETTANTAHYRGRSNVLAANTTCTLSVYAKAGERNFVGLQLTPNGTDYIYCTFNIQTGVASTPVNAGNGSGATVSIQEANNGWYRCVLTGIPSSTAANPLCAIYVGNANVNLVTNPYLGDGTSGIFLWGAQVEAGASASSYIGPTTTAAVTRAADILSITGSNFSSWYRQDEGTFYGDASTPFAVAVTEFPLIADSISGTDVVRLGFITESLAVQYVQVGGANQSELYPAGLTGVRRRRIASAMQANNFGIAVNGRAVLSDNSGSMPSSLTSLTIGQRSDGFDALNGHIRRLTYFPQRLPNNILQSLTS
jgi:hypothetical protein